jgi:hypothetical protein
MDPDENESSGEEKLLDQTPLKIRTLFHYFKSDGVDEKKRKKSPEESGAGRPEKRPKEEDVISRPKEADHVDLTKDPDNGLLQEETPKPKIKSINTFFKKISKDEYKKEIDRKSASSVLTVTAMVHSPSPEPPKVLPALRPVEAKKKKVKKSNVSRSSKETDTITVVETEEEKLQLVDDNAVLGKSEKNSFYSLLVCFNKKVLLQL